MKGSNEENESLLREAVDAQINYEKENGELKASQEIITKELDKCRQKIKESDEKFEQTSLEYEEKIASLTVSLTDSSTKASHLNNELEQLRQKIASLEE